MLQYNSGVTPNVFQARKNNGTPVTLKNIAITESGMKFYNSYRGSNIIEAACFKETDMSHIMDKGIKRKDSWYV